MKITFGYAFEKQEAKRVQHLEELRQKMYIRGCPHIGYKVKVTQREDRNGDRILKISCLYCDDLLTSEKLKLDKLTIRSN